MSAEGKAEAQASLAEARRACPVGVYAHHEVDGTYVVHGHSVDEASLTLLVHYYSVEKRSWWTRPVDVFLAPVVPHREGRTRFGWVRPAMIGEIEAALNP